MTLLSPGLKHQESMTVERHHIVPEVGRWAGFTDMPPVFATVMMIGFVEQTCILALRPYLDQRSGTVGTHVDMSHMAPTPVGGEVTAKIHLDAIDGKKLTFSVTVTDDYGLIGEGTHERAIIDRSRFDLAVVKRAETA